MSMALLEVQNLKTHFHTQDGLVRAVDGVSLNVEAGKTVGIVGESGSGKSVTNMTILGLVPTPPGIIDADAILFEGQDLRSLSKEQLRKLRGNRIAMVFQDPMTSLNPFLTIEDQLTEPLLIHKGQNMDQARQRVLQLLKEVGIPDPQSRLKDYPHQFSGGMRQRVMMAMALVCEPSLLICDEPTTALDVTIQAQILELLKRIQKEHGTTIIFITHDLGVAAGFCDEIYVMYAGRIVEHAQTDELFKTPLHPYTASLLKSVPRLDQEASEAFVTIQGSPPDLTALPAGCSFQPRCDHAISRCETERPTLEEREGNHSRQCSCFVDLRGEVKS